MVKVQQPKPKSLNKLSKTESNGIKKKSIEKSKKSASSLNTASAQKKLLIEKEVKVAEIVEPVKKTKKSKKENGTEKPVIATNTAVSKGNEKKKAEKPSAKKNEKSVALAPLESPVPVKKPVKGGKEKKVGKAPLILAPPESPGQAIKPVENQKGKKAGKTPLILAPPISPSPVKKIAKVNKEKKVGKAPLILAPPETPSPAPVKKAPKVNKEKPIKKGPLILAPPESPAPAPVTTTKATNDKKVSKKSLILAPPESPAPPPITTTIAKNDKKVSKKSLILAPPESPAPAPVTTTKTKNDKKLSKKSLVFAPPESPVQAPAPIVTKSAPVLKAAKGDNVKTTVKAPTVSALPQTASATPVAKPTKPRQSKAAIKKAKKASEATKKGVALAVKKPVETETEKPLTKKEETNRAKRAFIKAKRARKLTEPSADDKKSKKKRIVTYEPVEFDEAKFKEILKLENVQKIAATLKALVAEEVKKRKTSIFSDFRYFLNVGSFKIANVPKRMVKLSLKHSLVGEGDDVAIIVPDLQRGAKVDYDPTIQHYEDLFREAGVERLKIIPFNQLRNEMNSFETKRKFCNTYDYYLCDGRLSGQAHGLLGSYTQKPRTVLHAVRLVKENLKSEIERALRRTAYRQLQRGDLISIPVGNYHFTEQQVAENVLSVVEQLKTLHGGGHANVRSMNLKIDIKGTSSLPLYMSMSVPPAETPYIIGPREQRMLKLKSDANKVLAQFTLTKDAALIKLDPTQVENKRKLREAHAALTKNGPIIAEDQDAGENIAVPAKKARIDENAIKKNEKPQTDENKENLGKVENDDDDDNDEDDSSDEENEDESIEDDDDDEEEDEEEDDDDDDDEEEDDEE